VKEQSSGKLPLGDAATERKTQRVESPGSAQRPLCRDEAVYNTFISLRLISGQTFCLFKAEAAQQWRIATAAA
jgi:hypothetical protein